MSDIVKILPIEVSNKIAAGEVVQRPSSVLKELLENSIDANSTKIKVIIKNAGKNLIQVIDDGDGMSIKDMHSSFIKHATSKINSIDDVYSISNKKTLFPKNEYFKVVSMVSVANGLMESVLERRMELIRPTNEQSNSFINKQEIRIARTIKWLENNWKNYDDSYLTMDQIAIACSLEYTNFRLNNQWEKDSPNLIKWLNTFRQKDFMKSTVPLEAK